MGQVREPVWFGGSGGSRNTRQERLNQPVVLQINVESSGKEEGRKESGSTIRACAGCCPLGKATGGTVNRSHLLYNNHRL